MIPISPGGAILFAQSATKLPEANIQAEFYHHARLIGLNCVLEMSTPFGRHDVVCLSHDCLSIIAIVECKSGRYPNPHSKQMKRYRELGAAVFPLSFIHEAQALASKILSRLPNLTPVPITTALTSQPSTPRRQRRRKTRPLVECPRC